MRIRTMLLLLCICLTTTIFAQKKQNIILSQQTQFVRFNIIGLLDFLEPNLSLGYEYRLSGDWSVSTDMAWIFYSNYFEHTKHANGFILRPAVRCYIGSSIKRGFLEAELHYKYVVSTIEDWLGRDCVANVSAYEEFTKFNYLRQVIGYNLKIGAQSKIGRSNNYWIECYIGIGNRWSFQKVVNEPNSCYNGVGAFGETLRNGRISIAVPFGFRILYRLKR